MYRRFRLQVALVLSTLLWSHSAVPSSAADAKDEEAKEIARLVQESQRSGRERGDGVGFMAIWSHDAKLIAARSEKPGQFDSEITYSQLEALSRLKCGVGLPVPKDVKYEFTNVNVDISGDKAVLRYRSLLKQNGGTASTDEIYRLRKIDGKWKAYENRFWPAELRSADMTTEYNAATWEKLDAEVEKQKQNKNVLQQTIALLDAWRFPEAHMAAKKLTQEKKEDAVAWVVRGHAALTIADAKDALESFKRALQIDPKADVPPFIRDRKKD